MTTDPCPVLDLIGEECALSFPNANLFPFTAEVDARGRLALGGCDAVELAAEFGTPLYVFDEETLRGMCREFVGGFRSRYPDSSVIYACKAFINVGLARAAPRGGPGTGRCVRRRTRGCACVPNTRRSASTSTEATRAARSWRWRSSAASAAWWSITSTSFPCSQSWRPRRGVVQDITLRVSPGVDPHTHVYTTTGVLDSKFGFAMQTGDAAEAVERAAGERQRAAGGPPLSPWLAHIRAGAIHPRHGDHA